LLYPRRGIPIFPSDRRLGEPQGRSGYGGEEKDLCLRRELNPDFLAVRPPTDTSTFCGMNRFEKVNNPILTAGELWNILK
jgi:hypothetical protein